MVKKVNPKWEDKVKEWQASGKSVKAWCQEQKIPPTTFYGWRERSVEGKCKTKKLSKKKHFIELKDEQQTHSITLEFDGVKIHLSESFNALLLKRCLAVLRGV